MNNKPQSLKQFHDAYNFKLYKEEVAAEKEAAKKTPASVLSAVVFYGAIFAVVLLVFAYSQSSKAINLFGYSYFNILTTSMHSEIPQGSFILVKSVDPKELEVGDDITYFEKENKVVTHRIIEIYEDYEDSGMRGFSTKGVDNRAPDKYITYEINVIGKVIWHTPYLGFALQFISENILYIGIGLVGLFVLSSVIRVAITPEPKRDWYKEEDETSQEPSSGGNDGQAAKAEQ